MWDTSCFAFEHIPELCPQREKIFRFLPRKTKHIQVSIRSASSRGEFQMASPIFIIIYYFTVFYFIVKNCWMLNIGVGTCLIGLFWTLVSFFPGKLYKSKVCFTKHLWEHSVYWDLFDALKNQERVLSIQAAIILSQPYLEFLLVTSPTSTEKKKEEARPNTLHRKNTTRKRQRESSTCSVDF